MQVSFFEFSKALLPLLENIDGEHDSYVLLRDEIPRLEREYCVLSAVYEKLGKVAVLSPRIASVSSFRCFPPSSLTMTLVKTWTLRPSLPMRSCIDTRGWHSFWPRATPMRQYVRMSMAILAVYVR
jgi:hypothetical protein